MSDDNSPSSGDPETSTPDQQPGQLSHQEYQWCLDHLDEVTRRLNRVVELAEGTTVDDAELRDALARASSSSLYFKQQVTPAENSENHADLGDCPECGASLQVHPEADTWTKGKDCPKCDYGYLEGI